MKNIIFVFACLLSFSGFAQEEPSDSLHTLNHINYNLESHINGTTFKYTGRALTLLGAFSYYQKSKDAADQEKLNNSALIMVAGGLISLLSEIIEDVQEVKLGRVVNGHLTKNQNKSIYYESSSGAEESQNLIVLIGPRNFDFNREVIYTDKKGVEYRATITLYNRSSNCYVIEYEKEGRQKVVSVFENKHHRLSQE